jgi:hypothetical protein
MDLKKRRGSSDSIGFGTLILVFLMIVLALALTPSIGDLTYSILWNDTNVTVRIPNNITGASRDIIELVPLVWVFIVVGIGAAAVVTMFERIG